MAISAARPTPPLVVPEKPTYSIGSAPIRYKAHAVTGEPYADQLRTLLDPLIKADDASGAEAQLLLYAPQLSVEARAEAGQRVAFAYYVLGLDLDARRVADSWRQGATGEWASQAAWISGPRLVAARRLECCFERVPAGRPARPAARAPRRRLLLGGTLRAGRRPALVGRAAAEGRRQQCRIDREFLRASRPRNARHEHEARPRTRSSDSIRRSTSLPNVQRADELARIGEPALAEKMLRHQAMIGAVSEHHALIKVAKRLDLPAAQLWLADQRPVGRPLRFRRPLSKPGLASAQRLARRPRPCLWPHRPGIGLSPHRGQPGRRSRLDAGASDHGPADGKQSRPQLHPGQPHRSPVQSGVRPELHRNDAQLARNRRASCRGSSRPTTPVRFRSRNGFRSMTRAIHCCGSSPSLIGRPATTSPRS